jgi:hypothetical protein
VHGVWYIGFHNPLTIDQLIYKDEKNKKFQRADQGGNLI